VQSKNHVAHFLRVVDIDPEASTPCPLGDQVIQEAEKIEALNGPNIYSDFLRNHGRRPDTAQAAAIGRLMGARVRASDGTMQPALSRGERDAIRSIKKRRREWSRQVDHVQRTVAAIEALSKNHHEPEAVIGYGASVFDDPEIRKKLSSALEWLKRFAQESQRHGTGTRPQCSTVVAFDNQQSSERRADD
jgi:hypothetical protein